jgi:hypothetical protein
VISLKRSNNNVGLVDGSSCDCMSTCLYISLFVHVGNEPEPDTGPRRERERESRDGGSRHVDRKAKVGRPTSKKA